MRRIVSSASVLVALLMLSACTGFQVTGGVSAGKPIQERAPVDAVYDPDGPVAGATPENIVAGFLSASIAPEDGWYKAKLFLAADYVSEWDPRVATTVYSAYQFADAGGEAATPTPSATTAQVSVGMTATADISKTGVYAAAADSSARELVFDLEKDAEGQWRISGGPPGLLINTPGFEQIYAAYNLMFFDPTYSFLVPETRWYPRLSSVRDVVDGLLDGPSEWLLSAIRTAVPEGTRSLASIPVDSSTATISLSGIDKLDDIALGRLQLQLQESLKNTTVTTVDLHSDTRQITVPLAKVQSITVNQRALVVSGDKLGFLGTDVFDVQEEFAQSLDGAHPHALEISATSGHGVMQDDNGTVYRIGKQVDRAGVDSRKGLIAPTIGPFGDIWSVEATKPGEILVTSPGGESIQVPDALAPLTSVAAMQMSRDGTRLAVAGAEGSDNALYVFAVQRDATGKPTGLGTGVKVRDLRALPAVSLAWLDPLTVGLVVPRDSDTAFVVQPIGAPSAVAPAALSKQVVAIAGSSDAATRWVLAADGTLSASRGASWTSISTGVSVLARQQGPAAG